MQVIQQILLLVILPETLLVMLRVQLEVIRVVVLDLLLKENNFLQVIMALHRLITLVDQQEIVQILLLVILSETMDKIIPAKDLVQLQVLLEVARFLLLKGLNIILVTLVVVHQITLVDQQEIVQILL